MSEEKQPKYKLGNTVELKSGNSPIMTIVDVQKKPGSINKPPQGFSGTYECLWFDESKVPQTYVFIEEALILVKD
ncbi:DUF2158 domain-containing protein [Acinetobacter nectaris]|uniref:DUF2158 domain-containing protein n=1 Tax=Acinetobacter nectaris TaxID=1219382 RepID=UPI001F4086E0|nr:DUF2158 domain-containing protein [Acinetobacter nectaris]MCF9034417.1 DUF2158 domain-containing protein [Acinetobacter nectaris]